MNHRVGRITVAVALITIGALLIADNMLQTRIGWYIARLWPGLLVVLGIEWLAVSARLPAGQRVRVDGGAIAMLVIVAMVAMAFGASWRSPLRQNRIVQVPFDISIPQIQPPAIPLPQIPSIEPSVTYTAEEQQVLKADGVRDLLVMGGSGAITVKPGDSLSVKVKITAYGRDSREAQQNAARVQLRVTPGPTTQVQAMVPPDLRRVELAFDVTVPKEINLKLESGSGSLRVDGQQGNVTAQSASGEIRAFDIKGNVDLRTSSGQVTVARVDGDVTVTSSSGYVQVDGARGNVKASTTSGAMILSRNAAGVVAQVSSGSLTVDADQVGGNYDLTAVSGPIQLTLPSDAPVSVTARSSSGRVTGPSWLTVGEGWNSGKGVNGAGTYQVQLTTTSGGIILAGR